jgi:hypothetical protein
MATREESAAATTAHARALGPVIQKLAAAGIIGLAPIARALNDAAEVEDLATSSAYRARSPSALIVLTPALPIPASRTASAAGYQAAQQRTSGAAHATSVDLRTACSASQ